MILPRLHLPRIERARVLATLLFLVGGLVAVRLVQLMVINHADLEKVARRQAEDIVEIPGPRGDIVDRNGRLLATSIPIRVLAVEPHELDAAAMAALERATGTPGRITGRSQRRWLLVRRDCDGEVVRAVENLVKADIVPKGAVHWAPGFKRHYPHGSVAAHVLGFVTPDETNFEGVEKSYNNLLRSGKTRVLRATDAIGTSAGTLSGDPFPAPAAALMLTIDLRIQEKLEAALARARETHQAKSAQGVVLDPATGEVLAMASVPAYDPNTREGDQSLRRNPVIELPFEPGSVMKPLTAAALAQYREIGAGERVWCEQGRWQRGKWTLRDTHSYGWLTLSEVIAVSSNIGIVKFSQQLSNEQLHTTLDGLGLGHKTGIDLPAENGGKLRHFSTWRGPDRDTIAFGHSLMVTPLQLATAYGTIASGGLRFRPHVARAWGSPDGTWHPTPVPPEQRVLDTRAATRVALWMLGVVEEKRATGHRASVDGYRVAGKTGTAEKIENGRYVSGKNIATFAGFAPVANPAAVVVISLDEPTAGGHTGGAVAAPAFAEVMDETLRLLRVAPDYVPEPDENDESPRGAPAAPAPRLARAATPAPLPVRAVPAPARKGSRG